MQYTTDALHSRNVSRGILQRLLHSFPGLLLLCQQELFLTACCNLNYVPTGLPGPCYNGCSDSTLRVLPVHVLSSLG